MLEAVEPHHYSSHYSNSSTVLHYLVRIPPFTHMFLDFQGELLTCLPSACFLSYLHIPLTQLLNITLTPLSPHFHLHTGQNFDIPDRTFHSLSTSWRLSSSASLSDVKELIPEFFDFPDFLVNAQSECPSADFVKLCRLLQMTVTVITIICHCHCSLSL